MTVADEDEDSRADTSLDPEAEMIQRQTVEPSPRSGLQLACSPISGGVAQAEPPRNKSLSSSVFISDIALLRKQLRAVQTA
jgi:hypothetical protein